MRAGSDWWTHVELFHFTAKWNITLRFVWEPSVFVQLSLHLTWSARGSKFILIFIWI